MPSLSSATLLILVCEVSCWIAGIILGVRFIAGRLGSTRPALAPWAVSLEDFAGCVLMVVAGGILLPYVPAGLGEDLLGPAARNGDWWLVVQGAAFQIGLLGGIGLGALFLKWRSRHSAPVLASSGENPVRRPVLAGLITFLISLPLILGIGFAWKTLLEFLGYPVGEQDMVDLLRTTDDPALLVWMIALAAIIAPIAEELIFRAGLFRYFRTRTPRWLALTLPALVFALLHGNLVASVPLFTLGVFFALAYERTGRIAVPMIAHGLFNLHTILLVIAGVAS